MKAYTYLAIHRDSGKFYYGCRKSETVDIGITYFTSSKLVLRMISENKNSFDFFLRRKFNSYEEARVWENKFLRKIKCVSNSKCLNQAISSPKICKKDSESEKQRRISISNAMKKRWQDPEQRAIMTKSSEYYSSISKMRVHTEKKPKVSKNTKSYKIISIFKKEKVKQIYQNQTSAYLKCGWSLYQDLNPDCAHF